MMPYEHDPDQPRRIWTPLSRSELETVLARQEYTDLHLCVLSWLIWLSLLSDEEVLQLLSTNEDHGMTYTQATVSEQLQVMQRLGLIERAVLHEPLRGKQKRYYATDLGLYFYLSQVRCMPSLSMTRLVRSY